MNHIFSMGQVAKTLGVQPYRIAYAIETGQLPEASFQFLHKRCFTEADVRVIAQFFGVEFEHQIEPQKEAR